MRLSLVQEAGTIESILQEISDKGGFYFTYGEDIPVDDRIRIDPSRKTVREFLDMIFDGAYYCIEYNNKLVLKARTPTPEVYSVSGRVIDSGTGEPLQGVTVIIPESEPLIGAVTEEDGTFQIHVPLGMNVIRISCIGYETRRLDVLHDPVRRISLVPSSEEILEFDIIGYTNHISAASNISVSYLSKNSLMRSTGAGIDHILQGNASGVHVVNNSGMPGASLQIRLRGIHSLISSEPSIYLDGIPLQTSSLHAISPHDIESVEIRKDASSSSSYGSSAANGVVLLTSKTGKGDRFDMSVYHHTGIQRVQKTLDLLDTPQFLSYREKVLPEDDRFEGTDTLYGDSNWMDFLFNRALIEDTHVAISGGNERSDIYFSSNFYSQESIIKDLKYNRLGIRLASNHRVREIIQVGQSFSLTYLEHVGLKEGSFLNDFNNPILASMIALPFLEFSDSTGNWIWPEKEKPPVHYTDVSLVHNRRENYSLIGMVHTGVAITPSVSYQVRFGSEVFFQDNLYYSGSSVRTHPTTDGHYVAFDYNVLDHTLFLENSINFEKEWGLHHALNGFIRHEIKQSKNQWIPVSKTNYSGSHPSVGKHPPSIPQEDFFSNYRSNAGIAGIGYNYSNRLFVNSSLRRDMVGFYFHNELNRLSGIYPSASVGYVFLDERYGSKRDIFSYGKVRYSYGEAGNHPKLDYSYYASMMRSLEYVYAFGSGSYTTNSSAVRQTNERFYWEHSHAHNLGFDLSFLDNRIYFTLDLFRDHLHKGSLHRFDNPRIFTDQISQMNQYAIRPLPVAEMRNNGFDFELGYKHTTGNMLWEVNAFLSHMVNRVIQIDSSTYDHIHDGYYDPLSVNLPGEPAGSFFGYRIERLFTEEDCSGESNQVTNQPFIMDPEGNIVYAQPYAKAGDYKFQDINQDGVIDSRDKTILGHSLPDFAFGLNMQMTFKNLDFSMLWQGVYGNQVYNATKLWLFNPYAATNWSAEILNSYRLPEYNESGELKDPGCTDTDLHRFDFYAENQNLRVSDFYIEDGSYLRLKNLQIGYSFFSPFLKRVRIEKLRLFITFQNLITLTGYTGLDPEVGGWGIDCGIYPQPRIYLFGFRVNLGGSQ